MNEVPLYGNSKATATLRAKRDLTRERPVRMPRRMHLTREKPKRALQQIPVIGGERCKSPLNSTL